MKGQILNFKIFLILSEIRNIIKFFPQVSWLAFGAEECHSVLVASDLKFKYFIEFFALVLGPSRWGKEGRLKSLALLVGF